MSAQFNPNTSNSTSDPYGIYKPAPKIRDPDRHSLRFKFNREIGRLKLNIDLELDPKERLIGISLWLTEWIGFSCFISLGEPEEEAEDD